MSQIPYLRELKYPKIIDGIDEFLPPKRQQQPARTAQSTRTAQQGITLHPAVASSIAYYLAQEGLPEELTNFGQVSKTTGQSVSKIHKTGDIVDVNILKYLQNKLNITGYYNIDKIGFCNYYVRNGQPILHGLCTGYDNNANIIHRLMFNNGKLHGTSKAYIEDGRVLWSREFEDGNEIFNKSKYYRFKNTAISTSISKYYIKSEDDGIEKIQDIDTSENEDSIKFIRITDYSNETEIFVYYLDNDFRYHLKVYTTQYFDSNKDIISIRQLYDIKGNIKYFETIKTYKGNRGELIQRVLYKDGTQFLYFTYKELDGKPVEVALNMYGRRIYSYSHDKIYKNELKSLTDSSDYNDINNKNYIDDYILKKINDINVYLRINGDKRCIMM